MREGYNTDTKKMILRFLRKHADRAFSVEEIVENLRKEGGAMHPSTVYRCLSKLEALGSIMVFADESRKNSTYQISECELCRDHLHIKCTSCGKVLHLDCDFMEEMKEHLMHDHGFSITCQNSVIYGICSDCRKNAPESADRPPHKCTCGHHHGSGHEEKES